MKHWILIFITTSLFAGEALAIDEAFTVDASQIETSPISPQKKAYAYLDAAEKLMTPYGFMFSSRLVKQALRHDSNNVKARFLDLWIDMMMTFKGIFAKMDPVMKTYDTKTQEKYANYKGLFKADGQAMRFLYDSNEVFSKEQDFQKQTELLQNTTNDFRVFLKNNRNMNFTLTRYRELSSDWNVIFGFGKTTLRNCDVSEIRTNVFSMTACPTIGSEKVRVEMADAEVLRQVISLNLIYAVLATSYTAEGVLDVDRIGKQMDLTDKDIGTFLDAIPGFGRLKPNHQMGLVRTLGSDFFALYKVFMENQDRFCPRGYNFYPESQQRPGALNPSGSCQPIGFGAFLSHPNGKKDDTTGETVRITFEEFIQAYSTIANGAVVDIYSYSKDGTEHKSKADYMALFKKPVDDLKTLFPSKYNECGKPLKYRDGHFGGVYPNGDVNEHLSRTGQLSETCTE